MEETRNQKVQKWELLVQERLKSGLSVRKFCEANGYTENMYYHWVHVIHECDPDFDTNGFTVGQGAQVNSLVEIRPEEHIEPAITSPSVPTDKPGVPMAAIQAGPVRIDLFSNADTPFLRKLLEAVHHA
ncbi:MAG: hypothetical protein LUC41_05795 [Clostridiales bacterium]|nr:hypothetical protein [Clostridiales bacterium]